MKQNNQPKLQQLLGDKQILEQVAKSPDAKALASLLTQGQDQASLKQIAESAAKGDTSQLNQLIQIIIVVHIAFLLSFLKNARGEKPQSHRRTTPL